MGSPNLKLLIVGYGNPLRGDDGFGFLAAERLQNSNADPEVEVLVLHQLTPELMETLSRAGRAVFLDAAVGTEPGRMAVRRVEPDGDTSSGFTHSASPAVLLAGSLALYGRAPEAALVTVTGGDFEFGYPLTAPVRAALDSLPGTPEALAAFAFSAKA
jgi:hydrogenase maturation protease